VKYCRCEAPLLQCFLAHQLLTSSDENKEGILDGDGEYEPLRFSNSTYVSKYKALLSTAKEQGSQCIELLSSILIYMNIARVDVTDFTTKIYHVGFRANELYYHKNLTEQSRDLLGDQIYNYCQLAVNSYQVTPIDGKWILLCHVIMVLDQKLWNLIAFLVSKVYMSHTLLFVHYKLSRASRRQILYQNDYQNITTIKLIVS